jgi:hypothetical protein
MAAPRLVKAEDVVDLAVEWSGDSSQLSLIMDALASAYRMNKAGYAFIREVCEIMIEHDDLPLLQLGKIQSYIGVIDESGFSGEWIDAALSTLTEAAELAAQVGAGQEEVDKWIHHVEQLREALVDMDEPAEGEHPSYTPCEFLLTTSPVPASSAALLPQQESFVQQEHETFESKSAHPDASTAPKEEVDVSKPISPTLPGYESISASLSPGPQFYHEHSNEDQDGHERPPQRHGLDIHTQEEQKDNEKDTISRSNGVGKQNVPARPENPNSAQDLEQPPSTILRR